MSGRDAFAPTGPRTRRLFVDSSAFFALFHPEDEHHDRTWTFYESVADGTLPYRRLVTNDYVLDEVATRLRRRANHGRALNALATVVDNNVYAIEFTNASVFRAARQRFEAFDDQPLSFTDCAVVSHMEALGLDHLLSFDDDFAAFDCTVIPHYSS